MYKCPSNLLFDLQEACSWETGGIWWHWRKWYSITSAAI